MTEDPWDEPEARAFIEAALSDMAPKMMGSKFCLSLLPGNNAEGDVKYWVELGAMIMLDKPVALIVMDDNQRIPPKLEMIADAIIRLPNGIGDKESQRLIAEGIVEMERKLEEKGK